MSESRNSLLASLYTPDLRTKHGRVASLYMSRKGYRGLRPVGYIPVGDGASYFYYRLPEGLLELEISESPIGGAFRPAVTAFVTDPDDVRELLPA